MSGSRAVKTWITSAVLTPLEAITEITNQIAPEAAINSTLASTKSGNNQTIPSTNQIQNTETTKHHKWRMTQRPTPPTTNLAGLRDRIEQLWQIEVCCIFFFFL